MVRRVERRLYSQAKKRKVSLCTDPASLQGRGVVVVVVVVVVGGGCLYTG